MALNCISEGGTGVRRVKILSQDLVTSEIPVYERFLPRRTVRPSIWGASQHFSQKWLIFSMRNMVPAGAVSLEQHFLSLSPQVQFRPKPTEARQQQQHTRTKLEEFFSPCALLQKKLWGNHPEVHRTRAGGKGAFLGWPEPMVGYAGRMISPKNNFLCA